ncbi:conserved hypothetical protein [Trichinella spiralis]|uniref:hypothetical protein n=1 Tax=Trichinella spiralis TaxID=6334 RepID=UPI0001EFDE26|nr:conserved hypothetical protein [Trichinella spiralis]
MFVPLDRRLFVNTTNNGPDAPDKRAMVIGKILQLFSKPLSTNNRSIKIANKVAGFNDLSECNGKNLYWDQESFTHRKPLGEQVSCDSVTYDLRITISVRLLTTRRCSPYRTVLTISLKHVFNSFHCSIKSAASFHYVSVDIGEIIIRSIKQAHCSQTPHYAFDKQTCTL